MPKTSSNRDDNHGNQAAYLRLLSFTPLLSSLLRDLQEGREEREGGEGGRRGREEREGGEGGRRREMGEETREVREEREGECATESTQLK